MRTWEQEKSSKYNSTSTYSYLSGLVCSIKNCEPFFGKITCFLKCQYCFKVFCDQGKNPTSHVRPGLRCSYHYCPFYGYKYATQPVSLKWAPKTFNAFKKTFFEIGYLRNNLIYKVCMINKKVDGPQKLNA